MNAPFHVSRQQAHRFPVAGARHRTAVSLLFSRIMSAPASTSILHIPGAGASAARPRPTHFHKFRFPVHSTALAWADPVTET